MSILVEVSAGLPWYSVEYLFWHRSWDWIMAVYDDVVKMKIRYAKNQVIMSRMETEQLRNLCEEVDDIEGAVVPIRALGGKKK